MSIETQPAVYVDGVTKTFHIPNEQVHTLKEKALHPFRNTGHHTLNALRNVSFRVDPGEFFGIVGRNGSGKSTMLKCIAGIYRADQGRIFVNGRMSTFIELGVGFNPDLAARDNVMLNATMLGLSTREARYRFDAIIDFAELQQFVDLKLKNYSSGMLVRLAFAVMIQVDADILLIDEVLAVGDAAFQQKCFDEFGRIRRSGATVLLVTHDMTAVQRFCDRAVLLEKGRDVELGETELVSSRYLQLNFSEEARAEEEAASMADDEHIAEDHSIVAPLDAANAQAPDEPTTGASHAEPAEPVVPDQHGAESFRLGDRKAEITSCWAENENREQAPALAAGRPCAICFAVTFNEPVEDPIFGFNLYNAMGEMVWAANNVLEETPSGRFAEGETTTVRIAFTNVFAPDRYWITPAIARDRNGLEWHDRRHRLASVVVMDTRPHSGGVVGLPFTFELDHKPVTLPAEGQA